MKKRRRQNVQRKNITPHSRSWYPSSPKPLVRHHGNLYLTSLPLGSVRHMAIWLRESRDKISTRVKAPFPLYTTYFVENTSNELNISRLSIGFLVLCLRRESELWKLPMNSSFYAITADSKSRWPHSRKAYFRGVHLYLFQHVQHGFVSILLFRRRILGDPAEANRPDYVGVITEGTKTISVM